MRKRFLVGMALTVVFAAVFTATVVAQTDFGQLLEAAGWGIYPSAGNTVQPDPAYPRCRFMTVEVLGMQDNRGLRPVCLGLGPNPDRDGSCLEACAFVFVDFKENPWQSPQGRGVAPEVNGVPMVDVSYQP